MGHMIAHVVQKGSTPKNDAEQAEVLNRLLESWAQRQICLIASRLEFHTGCDFSSDSPHFTARDRVDEYKIELRSTAIYRIPRS